MECLIGTEQFLATCPQSGFLFFEKKRTEMEKFCETFLDPPSATLAPSAHPVLRNSMPPFADMQNC